MDINSIVNILEIITVIGGCIMWFANIKHSQKSNSEQQSELHDEYKIVTKKIEVLNIENAHFRTELEVLKLRVTMLERP